MAQGKCFYRLISGGVFINLFEGYKNVNDDEIMDQIAVLKSVSFSNVLKIQAGKTRNKVANIFNKVSDRISNNVNKDSFLNYKFRFNQNEIKEMSDYLSDERKKIENKNRNSLNNLLKNELVKNVETDKFNNKSVNNINEQELSNEMINTAARWKKLEIKNPDDLEIKSKAEVITNNFNSILIQQLSKVDKKMETEDKKKTDKKIEKQLNNMSKERREAIKDSLNIEELSGEVLRKAILSSSGPLATIGIVNISGIGAYVALTTVMNAIFTTVLGVTLPFGVYTTATSGLALLAGPVGWLLVLGFGGRQFLKGNKTLKRILLTQAIWFSYNYIEYNVDEDDMPEWVPDRKKNKISELEDQKDNLLNKVITLKTKKEEISKELEIISNLKNKYQNEKMKIKSKIKTKEKEVNNLLKMVDEIQEDKEKELTELDKVASESIADFEEKITKLKNEKAKLKYELKEKENMVNEFDENAKELENNKDKADFKINKNISNIINIFDIFSYTNKAKKSINKLNRNQLNYFFNELYKVTKNHFNNSKINIRKTIKSLNHGKIIELGFGGNGRIYLSNKKNKGEKKYEICIVGDKNSQDKDIAWLRKNY